MAKILTEYCLARTSSLAYATGMHRIISRFVFIAATLCCLASESRACLNNYVTNEKAVKASRDIAKQLYNVELVEPWENRRNRLRETIAAGGGFKVKNDLANALMHTGEAALAVAMLQQIEQEHPGLYPTASNLGTAYELTGDNEKALEWIRKGIERNPLSHQASEWIHVRILEAKIATKSDPSWPDTHPILGLDFGTETIPRNPSALPAGNTNELLSLAEIESGITHQLRERLQFIKFPDAVVSELIFDLANIVALKPGGMGQAQGLYELAIKAGVPHSKTQEMAEDRLAGAKRKNMMEDTILNQPTGWLVAYAIIGALLLWLVWKVVQSNR